MIQSELQIVGNSKCISISPSLLTKKKYKAFNPSIFSQEVNEHCRKKITCISIGFLYPRGTLIQI
jgi:hypothetical protein